MARCEVGVAKRTIGRVGNAVHEHMRGILMDEAYLIHGFSRKYNAPFVREKREQSRDKDSEVCSIECEIPITLC